ncbi:ATP-dependent helicase [Galbibacter sp. EGI 63066]|uniref:UvrD-helicase domain-containing protein n=1 Tax=Galbibacter sp. EGI 63066 TaxID=2993559 RepID=UPI0022493AEE|nr:ATP-dependent helicase [Galbibacter sp. EGI 63066]MCX2680962.1 ATP-dependent helicase [Galbibacter sp. EGI 63066]
MVEERLTLEPEVQEIFQCIDSKRNFLLSGGAGSGKTYSLVQVIRQVIAEYPTAKVACMTYTNAAVKEIEERVNHKNLNVSTIHDFLWDNIKHFQKELKAAIIALANDEDAKISIGEDGSIPDNYFDELEKGIQYKEYLKLKEGIISHDELLLVANHLFEKYPKLSAIVKDKYQFIFIDEYQDTNTAVVDIILNHFKKSEKNNLIGFFGDAMQSIYDDGIGNLDEYKGDAEGDVKEVKKAQNRRSPRRIIDLANRLRTDGITQEPSTDEKAPNMMDGQVKEGNIQFIHSANGDVSLIKQYLTENHGWNFENAKETKELNLTHNLIADKAGFRTLMDIYDKDLILSYRDRVKKYIKNNAIITDFSQNTFREVIAVLADGKVGRELKAVRPTASMQTFIDGNQALYQTALNYNYEVFSKFYVNKDQLLDDKKQDEDDENKKGSKRDNLIKHLFKIQNSIVLYQTGRYNEFLRATDYKDKIVSIAAKRILKDNIEGLINVRNKTIEEVINDAHEKGICLIDDKLEDFKARNEYLYNRVREVGFCEFQKLYDYLEGKTPFSTQHKTKGTEFNNVLVILDNGGWNKYNFENMFLNTGTASVLERTQKIFYVCCTRAKENLAVFYHNPSPQVVGKAKEWFGEQNVIPL